MNRNDSLSENQSGGTSPMMVEVAVVEHLVQVGVEVEADHALSYC